MQAYYHHKARFVLKVIWHVNKISLRFTIHYFINNLLIVVFYVNIYMKVLKLISKITIYLKQKKKVEELLLNIYKNKTIIIWTRG